MTLHYVRSDVEFTSDNPGDTDDEFDAFTDRLEDALIDLAEKDPRLIDPSMAGSLRDRRMNVLMGVDANSGQEAAQIFSAALRSALSEAECETPEWPTFRPEQEPNTELVDA